MLIYTGMVSNTMETFKPTAPNAQEEFGYYEILVHESERLSSASTYEWCTSTITFETPSNAFKLASCSSKPLWGHPIFSFYLPKVHYPVEGLKSDGLDFKLPRNLQCTGASYRHINKVELLFIAGRSAGN